MNTNVIDDHTFTLLKRESFPLDSDLISSLATEFTYCDPKNCLTIPNFRIRELLKLITSGSTLANEFRLVEAVLALYILCTYFGMSTTYDYGLFVDIIKVFQSLYTESLINFQNGEEKKERPLIMRDLISSLAKDVSIDIDYKLEIFEDNLQLMRFILQETLSLSNNVQQIKDLKIDERKTALPAKIECVKPYCIYFSINFAIAHISLMLHTVGNISLLPGCIEMTFIGMLTDIKESENKITTNDLNHNPSNFNSYKCIKYANKLSTFIGHNIFDEGLLEPLVLTKSKLRKLFVNPAINVAQYKISNFRTILGISSKFEENNLPNSNKMCPQDKEFYFFTDYKPAIELSVKDNGDNKEDSDLDKSSNQGLNLNPRQKHLAGLKKSFRCLFILFDILNQKNKSHTFLNIKHLGIEDITKFDLRGELISANRFSNLTLTNKSKYLENYYLSFFYHPKNMHLPRLWCPLDEIYWIIDSVIEYLYTKTTSGYGLRVSLKREAELVQKNLFSYKLSKNEMVDHKKKSKNRINLVEKLQQAKKEAELESRLHKIQTKLQFSESFPDLGSLKSNSSSEQSLKQDEDLLSHMLAVIQQGSLQESTNHHFSASTHPSVVWNCRVKTSKILKVKPMIKGSDNLSYDNPLDNLPSELENFEYCDTLKKQKIQIQLDEENFKKQLENTQEMIVNKNRIQRNNELKLRRERMKEEINSKQLFKNYLLEQKLQLEKERNEKLMEEKRQEEEIVNQNKFHVNEIKMLQKFLKQKEKEEYEYTLRLEKDKIKHLLDQDEFDEIKRRLEEEEAMKKAEEKRRVIEMNRDAKLMDLMRIKQAKRDKLFEDIQRSQARVRRGNFQFVKGEYKFYDNVRKKIKEYIQYEDENGIPYYFDPILQFCQYRKPEDGEIKHHIDKEREDYDEAYGEGAYDAFMADRAYKDAINRDGGYYNDRGDWVVVYGYYDENYNWVDSDGYYDENGKYIKYPKVTGDLSFMV